MTAPLEWADLWAAMDADPAAWIETTEGMYWHMLEVLPPRCMKRDSFLVGEARRHNSEGNGVYACFKREAGRHFAKHLTVAEYKEV